MTGEDIVVFFTFQTILLTLVGVLVGYGLRQLNLRRGWLGVRVRVVQAGLVGFVSFALVYILFWSIAKSG
jgi:hypothetical protein